MEMYELRYFLAVAERENVNRAALDCAVSAGSLSKAVARLESELGVKLFERVRRNIRLTAHGRSLKLRAAEILSLEAAAKAELQGRDAPLQVRLCGPEILLLQFAPALCQDVRAMHPKARFELHPCGDAEAVERVGNDAAHAAITTAAVPAGFSSKLMAETEFRTCVGRGHPLFRAAKTGKTIPVSEVLEHPFVTPSSPILGLTQAGRSSDGWRDDRFPRKLRFVTESLRLIEELVVSGEALAYLPDTYIERLPVATLSISGCPHTCRQSVRLLARKPEAAGWLNALFL